ncbi:MAG: hypothetical protein JSV62_10700 [Promethearchaeota archaeon]|nr:MAG: hypothetical protein JSV62_10700 [Candidatus Lokiarchaeota archaeon]
MSSNIISKVVELDNCNKDKLIKAIYTPEFWLIVNPSKTMQAEFIAPNVLYTKITDEIINIKIEMEGELVLQDRGEQEEGKGQLIDMNVRNNKDVRDLEGRMRIKTISSNKSKLGVFINNFTLSSDFLGLIGRAAAELALRTKITEMLRNLEKWLRSNSLDDLI